MASVDIDTDTLRWRLAETIAWCSKRASSDDPMNSLRSCDLRPPIFMHTERVYDSQWEQAAVQVRTVLEIQAIVDNVAVERANRLRLGYKVNDYPNASADDLAGGRILLYDPYNNLFDGAAESETYGFFDIDNVPPWDTWVCCVGSEDGIEETSQRYAYPYYSFLVSWVPPQFVELVDEGIKVNPEACILWATNIDSPLTRQLKEAGLLG